MTEEYGGVHTIERRSGVDRRASTWREAVDQQHEARRRQYVALLAALDALVVELKVSAFRHRDDDAYQRGTKNAYGAVHHQLSDLLAMHRAPR